MNKHVRLVFVTGLLLVTIMESALGSGWNMPYSRPSKYDYTSSYAPSMINFLGIVPDYFESSFAKAWTYYKSHYIMSNGLVNHMRGLDVGTNEAVSEGQGYGMLLALLNNDQPTFNRIFGAANSILWDNGRKSYNWQYLNGAIGVGAATDADLDIGLALVFADELRKKGLWETYSSGSITYNSRAMEIIRSLRNTMCRNNYLLPGDTWSDPVNNLNPSYFATAWLKVFNRYQSEVDFSAVIDKCYTVLRARTSQYNKGQAPDWCRPDGTRASERQGLGMTSDGIRTPWRIAMDAVWFSDPRAIEYCLNSKNTLTNYASTDESQFLRQMSHYDENGAQIASTAGSFSEVAMWSTAILGSKDREYMTKAFTSDLFGRIVGVYDCFGDVQGARDHYYYYKQSIGMLGFALISGQFPNVLDDMQNSIPPAPVILTQALSANKTSVALPGAVVFTAQLDAAASWTITVSGVTSGKSEVFSGSGTSISATWTGSGWYTVEVARALLHVANLDPNTAASSLIKTVQITAVPDRPAIVPGSQLSIHDIENASSVNSWGGAWYVYSDKGTEVGGASTVAPADATDLPVQGSGNGPSYGVKTTFNVAANTALGYQYAGVGMNFAQTNGTADVSLDMSMFESITFDYRTENIVQSAVFSVVTSNIIDDAYGRVMLGSSATWKTQTVRFAELIVPTWGSLIAPDFSKTTKIQWQLDSPGGGILYLDNIKAKLKSGALPGPDILSRINQSMSISFQNRLKLVAGKNGFGRARLSSGTMQLILSGECFSALGPSTVSVFTAGGRLIAVGTVAARRPEATSEVIVSLNAGLVRESVVVLRIASAHNAPYSQTLLIR